MADPGTNTSAVCAHVVWTSEHCHDGSATDVCVGVCKVHAGQHTADTCLDDPSALIRHATGCCCFGRVGHLVYREIKVSDSKTVWNNRLLS